MKVALTSRCYLFEDGGVVKRIPRRLLEGLIFGKDAIPEYANSVQRIATAIIENETGKPIKIVDARGGFFTFDEEGRIDEALRKSTAEAMDLLPTPNIGSGNVVSLSPTLKRRQFREKNRWHLAKEHLDWIAADVWPREDGRPAHVTIAIGKAPRRPPLTYEAKEALRNIREKIISIECELERLSEAALKGLAFETRKEAEDEAGLWSGVADECDRLRELRARQRTGRGIWYAVIEAERSDRNDVDVMHVDEVAFEKCTGRKLAAEAARRLLKEHADTLQEDLMLRSALYSELEWEPPKER
jgi:hypothetical protein